MSIRSPRNVIAQHNQHLWFWSNGQPIEMSQLAQREALGKLEKNV